MCGIVGIFKIKQQTQELRQKALKMSQKTPPPRAGLERHLRRRICHPGP